MCRNVALSTYFLPATKARECVDTQLAETPGEDTSYEGVDQRARRLRPKPATLPRSCSSGTVLLAGSKAAGQAQRLRRQQQQTKAKQHRAREATKARAQQKGVEEAAMRGRPQPDRSQLTRHRSATIIVSKT